MFQTFDKQFFPLRDSVRVFPGHDYIENNLGFTLDREAGNKAASELKDKFAKGLNAESFVSTIGLEREINVFFRLEQNEVRDGVASSLNLNLKDLDDEKTFIGLRRLRDNW
jgi:hydroxyacylglutathione hydrolase